MGSYEVVCNGVMLAMDRDAVIADFARLFRIAPDKAAAILARPHTVLRSRLDMETAERYREKLMAIGLDVDVRHSAPPKPVPPRAVDVAAAFEGEAPPALALEPLPDDYASGEVEKIGYRGNRTLSFDFLGSATECCCRWMANLALTVLTLGIYAIWSGGRSRQYWYGNTQLDGMPFGYRAGMQLPGWLWWVLPAGLVFAIQQQLLSTQLAIGAVVLYLVLLPALAVWIVAACVRRTTWRQVSFGFLPVMAELYRLAWLPVLLVAVVAVSGLLLPDAANRQSSFLALAGWTALSLLAVGWPYWHWAWNRLLVTHTVYGDTCFGFAPTAGAYYRLYWLKLPAILLLTALLCGVLLLGAGGPALRQQWEALWSALWSASPGGVQVVVEGSTYAVFAGMALLVVAGVVLWFACLQASLFKLRYHGLSLGKSVLSSDIRTWSLWRLYISNTLAIVLSLGLLIPWAQMRVVRYRLSCLSLFASYELDDFISEARKRSGVH